MVWNTLVCLAVLVSKICLAVHDDMIRPSLGDNLQDKLRIQDSAARDGWEENQ